MIGVFNRTNEVTAARRCAIEERLNDLERAGQPVAADSVRLHANDGHTLEPDVALGRRMEAGEEMEHRRLTGQRFTKALLPKWTPESEAAAEARRAEARRYRTGWARMLDRLLPA